MFRNWISRMWYRWQLSFGEKCVSVIWRKCVCSFVASVILMIVLFLCTFSSLGGSCHLAKHTFVSVFSWPLLFFWLSLLGGRWLFFCYSSFLHVTDSLNWLNWSYMMRRGKVHFCLFDLSDFGIVVFSWS